MLDPNDPVLILPAELDGNEESIMDNYTQQETIRLNLTCRLLSCEPCYLKPFVQQQPVKVLPELDHIHGDGDPHADAHPSG